MSVILAGPPDGRKVVMAGLTGLKGMWRRLKWRGRYVCIDRAGLIGHGKESGVYCRCNRKQRSDWP